MGAIDIDRVWVCSPFGQPSSRLALAAAGAGARPLVPLAADRVASCRSLRQIARSNLTSFGVEVLAGCDMSPAGLPSAVDTILLSSGVDIDAATLEQWRSAPGRPRVVVEVVSRDDATDALAAGADGLVVKGTEAGGRIGDTSTFILLQQCSALTSRPLWARGGIGENTAAAAVAGGAAGVVIDVQVALFEESLAIVPAPLRRVLSGVDGSETRVVGHHRLYARPDLPAATMDEGTPVEDVALRLGTDLRSDLVPLGQDAAFAAPLAERFGTLDALVDALGPRLDERLRSACAQAQLGPRSRLADRHGLGVPVVQGPMTRVSDRAGFAGSVAAAGGLPLLALSVMGGADSRALLEATRDQIGDRPWGAGILGFVPPELRDEQLAAILDAAPRFALIAGGRPSQAAVLEAAGIVTFLHVPSPGLLDQFLRDGARHFVFEGRECGGHVGPRTSFVLWEQQIQRLLAFGAGRPGNEPLADVDVLFAGGVHDERSAAMVAALAEPLVAAGASFGVLMGSAYLFTEEAVADGAILPGFQSAAVECNHTVLFETAPGHATRGADSDFVRMFLERKAEMIAAETPAKDMWAVLEELNLGRLRIASKGLVRGSDGLAEIDEATQRREGMYMLGDVATLRDQVTTIAGLHHQVSGGAVAHLVDRVAELDSLVTTAVEAVATPEDPVAPVDVAIIGMACFLPGADGPEQFWSNLVHGVDSVSEVPASRWDPELYFDPDNDPGLAGRKTPSRWGGFVPAIRFDALSYGIPPRSLSSIEPVQLLALEVSARALADAGYVGDGFDRSRVSVIFGAEAGNDLASTYGMRSLLPTYVGQLPAALDAQLPTLTEDSFPGMLANVITGRIANRLDLGGANYTVDAACASSLSAVDAACKELLAGTSDMVLCGGADLHNGIGDYLAFSSVHALSPTGRCRTFDADADGIAISEGVACVVLKRLADAERDGDHIYAVIRSVAASSDGRHLGLTAPRKEGQRLAVERAYRRAGLSPAEVGLVEAHGTGTVVGDRTEMSTLAEVFEEHGAASRACALGSAKSNIGHTKCAAGLAGLIKAALAVERGVVPPTLHVKEPNQAYFDGGEPFRLPGIAEPWISASPSERIAGVSAFGFGGTNFHTVISGHGTSIPEHGLIEWPAEVFVFRGADRQAALELVELLDRHVAAHVAAGQPPRLRDLAATIAESGRGAVQVAVVATDLADLQARLVDAAAFRAVSDSVFVPGEAMHAGGKVAWCFPGQGSQKVGMLADLFVAFPFLRSNLEPAGELIDRLYPPRAFNAESIAAQRASITDTRVAQPLLGMVDLAMADLLTALDVTADMAGGHSYGELVALTAAGAIDRDDLVELSRARGEAILTAAGDDPGAMAAVSADATAIEAVLEGVTDAAGVVVANHNSPQQSVVSGPSAAIDAAITALGAAGLATKLLPVACGFHSGVVAGATHRLHERLQELQINQPTLPVYANVTAAPYGDQDVRSLLAEQVAAPVRWVEQVEAMYAAGARVFVEVGPGAVLTRLAGQILGDRPHVAVACDPGGDGVVGLLRAVAALGVASVEMDLDLLFGARARLVDLSATPTTSQVWTVDGHLVRGSDGVPVTGGLRPADAVTRVTMEPVAASAPPADHAVLTYLQGMRELVAAQRDVMLAALGGQVAMASPLIEVRSASASPTTAFDAQTPPVAHEPLPSSVAPSVGLDAAGLLSAVLDIVAERTGYPLEMLDPDLDLEADLSIDSIKRIEILGGLSAQVDLSNGGQDVDESVVEELAQIKTVRGIVDWIVANGAVAAADVADSGSPAAAGSVSVSVSGEDAVTGVTLDGFVARAFTMDLTEMPVAVSESVELTGASFALVGGDKHPSTPLLEQMLADAGASVRRVDGELADPATELSGIDGLIDLRCLVASDTTSAAHVFPEVRAAAMGGARWIFAVTGMGGMLGRPSAIPGSGSAHGSNSNGRRRSLLPSGAGVAGLMRTVQREYPDARCRSVDLDQGAEPSLLAGILFDEITGGDHHVAIGHAHGLRHVPVPGSPGDGPPAARAALALGPDSVVVLTGGGRGITARVAAALASETGCSLVLLGRTALPEMAEPPEMAAATDDLALRRYLISTGVDAPREVEQALRQIRAQRELLENLSLLGVLAAHVEYLSVDVRDSDALAATLAGVRAKFGHIDLVVHGAGVLDDRFLRDKTLEGFAAVFETKVAAAEVLAADLQAHSSTERPASLVLFGSVSGVFGNRGQCDYSAANDALDVFSWSLAGSEGLSVISIDWGPWGGTGDDGMVTEELQREYARRGIGLLHTDDAVAHLFAALANDEPPSQIVVMAGSPESFHTTVDLRGRPDPREEEQRERSGI